MVKLPNLPSAIKFAGKMDGLAPGASMDRLMRNANEGWGFADAAGNIDGNNGFWMKDGKPTIGDMDLSDFLKKSRKAQIDYLNSDVFSASVMSRVDGKMGTNFSPDMKKSLDKGAPAVRAAQVDFMDVDGKTVKASKVGAFSNLMDKFSTKMRFGAKVALGAWTLSSLLELAEAGSGCFLVGPEGQEEKVGVDCSCSEGNPNATSCCEACNSGGDEFLCPGVEWVGDDPPANYVCPGDVSGRARQMRATMSVAAARAAERAATLPKVAAAAATSVSCGCVNGGEWRLEQRELTVFDAMGGLLASAGMMLVNVAGDLWDVVLDGLGGVLAPLTTIFIVVGVVVGLAVVAGVTVAVLKARKRIKPPNY